MARLKGLRDRRGRVFTKRFIAEDNVPVVGDASFTATAMIVNKLTDASVDTIDSIVSVSRGGAKVQTGTNTLTLDLRGQPQTTDVVVVYNATTGGVPAEVTAVVTCSAPFFARGWGKGEFYRPEVDGSTDDLVIEPAAFSTSAGTRVVLTKPDGLTAADIAAREVGFSNVAEGSVTGTWLRNNKAKSGTESDAYYGETDALALSWPLARALAKQLRTEFNSPWFLAKRGTEFSNGVDDLDIQATFESFGISGLHPVRFGAYGSGARPHFNGRGIAYKNLAWNLVAGSYTCTDNNNSEGYVRNVCLDDIFIDQTNTDTAGVIGGEPNGLDLISRNWSMRRIKGKNIQVKTSALGNAFWGGVKEASSSIHPGKTMEALIEKFYVDRQGYAHGYRADNSVLGPKGPDNYGHGLYQSNNAMGFYFKDILLTWPCHNAAQFRSGGIVEDFVAMGHGNGINPGLGPFDRNNVIGLGNVWAGQFSMLHRTWFGEGGFKGLIDQHGYAAGVEVSGQNVSLIDSGAINSGEPVYFDAGIAAELQFGPGSQPDGPPGSNFWYPITINLDPGQAKDIPEGLPGTVAAGSNYVVSNFNRNLYPDGTYADGETQTALPAGAANQATRDAATIGAYTDTLLSSSNSTLRTFSDHMADNVDAPWTHAKLLADYWAGVVGFSVSPTPVADETLTFRPHATHFTPGFWACLKIDWDKQYLPGDTTGNSVDLDGHRVTWNFTPKNDLATFTFGPGGRVDHCGGKVVITTLDVDAGGNTWDLYRGAAKLDLPAYAGANVLTLSATDSRIRFLGNTTGAVDLSAHWNSEVVVNEGAALTIASGRTWNVYGYSKVGFDGSAGGAASITNAGTLAIKPAIKLEVDGMTRISVVMNTDNELARDFYCPKIGTIIRGVTSGATGIVRDRKDRSISRTLLIVDTVSGEFLDNETLTGDDCEHFTWDVGSQTVGLVRGPVTYVLPTIGEVHTGLNGFANPDGSTTTPMRPIGPSVASSFVCGSTLDVDLTGTAIGASGTLVTADSVSGSFATVTASGDTTGKLLTVNKTGTTVTYAVTAGSGTVNNT